MIYNLHWKMVNLSVTAEIACTKKRVFFWLSHSFYMAAIQSYNVSQFKLIFLVLVIVCNITLVSGIIMVGARLSGKVDQCQHKHVRTMNWLWGSPTVSYTAVLYYTANMDKTADRINNKIRGGDCGGRMRGTCPPNIPTGGDDMPYVPPKTH